MSLYLKFLSLAFKEKYTYKFDFYVSILASMLVVFVQVNVWTALYKGTDFSHVVSLEQVITYVLLSFVIFNLTRSEVSIKIGKKVEDGSIIADFIRPVNFKSFLLAEDLGNNFFQFLFVSIPAVILSALFCGFSLEGDLLTFIIFLMSVILGVLIAFHIKFIIGLFSFWLETSWYIPFFVGAIFELFSGSTIPLWFYPSWLQAITDWLPFRFIFFEPIAIFLNKYSTSEAALILVLQLAWLLIMIVIERWIWIKAQQEITVNGG
ncbi:MAG: ABC-2 family transporter protein [Bacilli bacterium]